MTRSSRPTGTPRRAPVPGVKGLNALLAVVSTPSCAPVIVAAQLRNGSANSTRGAHRFVTDTLITARKAGATGVLVLSADSAYYAHERDRRRAAPARSVLRQRPAGKAHHLPRPSRPLHPTPHPAPTDSQALADSVAAPRSRRQQPTARSLTPTRPGARPRPNIAVEISRPARPPRHARTKTSARSPDRIIKQGATVDLA